MRQEQFDIPLSSNRRHSFTDQRPVTGASPFDEQKALSAPMKTLPRTPPVKAKVIEHGSYEKARMVPGVFNPYADDEDSILFGSSAEKARKPVHESPQSLSRRAVDEARAEVKEQSDLISQVIGKPASIGAPAKRVSIKPDAGSKSLVAGSGMGAIPKPKGAGGRPAGSKNKTPHHDSVASMEFG